MLRWLARRVAGGDIRVRYAPGAVLGVDPADYIGWSLFRTGAYEPASLALALRLMREQPGLFVDVGANTGLYSCAVAAIAGTAVISIEPDCANCTLLRKNLALNRRRNVTVFNGAVGDNFEAVRLAPQARGNSGTVAIKSHRMDGDRTAGCWVAAIPLARLLERLSDRPVRPVVVKIDVEGFEPRVLAGIDFSGPSRPQNIIMEFDPVLGPRAWGSVTAVEQFFAGKGYELLDIFGTPLSGVMPEANIWARDALPQLPPQ